MNKLIAVLSLLTFALSACSTKQLPASPSESVTSFTFVLVHGALFTGAGWLATENELRKMGQKAISFDVPGRNHDGLDPKKVDLYLASSKVCEVVRNQNGKVVLVGHSQGGALINQALQDCGDKVQAVIYVAAVVPLNNEIPFQGLDPKIDTGWGKVTNFDSKRKLFYVNRKGPVHEIFFGDIGKDQAKQVIASMVSEPSSIGTEKKITTPNSVILAKPLYYIETTEDKVISIQSQRRFQSRVPGIKVITMQTSHSPFLSKPSELAANLVKIGAQTR